MKWRNGINRNLTRCQEIKRIIRNIQSDLPALAGIESEVQETAPIETEAEAEELEAGRDAELVDTDL